MTLALRMMLLAAAIAVGMAGCVAGRDSPPRPVAAVNSVEMMGLPAAVDLDGRPGPDGWAVQVFLFQAESSSKVRTVTVSGTLQFLLLAGDVAGSDLLTATPIHTWSFTGPQLSRNVIRRLGLWGYGLRLQWPTPRPQAGTVTLVVRYKPPEGDRWVYAKPTVSIVPRDRAR